jgi:hypothetical protein
MTTQLLTSDYNHRMRTTTAASNVERKACREVVAVARRFADNNSVALIPITLCDESRRTKRRSPHFRVQPELGRFNV